MDRLPKEIINKIFYFTCHPVAAMFNDEAHLALEQYEQNDDLYYNVVKEIEIKQRTTHLNGRCDFCFKPFLRVIVAVVCVVIALIFVTIAIAAMVAIITTGR